MGAFTVYWLMMGATAPFIGRLVDRYGPMKLIAIGAFITGLGFGLLSFIHNLWHFYVGWIIIGVGMTGMGPIPSTAAVSNWFQKRRGTALGIMSTGIGAGGVIMAPLLGNYFIPDLGWRMSFLVITLIVWLLIPLVVFAIRMKPADIGVNSDGSQTPEAVVEAKASPLVPEGLTLKMALATSAFWLINVSYLSNGFSQVGVVQNQVPYLGDIGFPVAIAAGALGGVSFGSLVSKLFFGWLCDRIQPKYAWCLALVFTFTSIVVFMNVRPASPLALIWLYAIFMGLASGGWLPTMSMVTSTTFGLAYYGTIFGMVNLAYYIGLAAGPLMAGYMYDIMGTYQGAFIIFLVLTAVAMPAILAVRRPKLP